MAKNYDVVTNDAYMMAAKLRQAGGEGRFPKHMVTKFVSGGEVFVQVRNFLLSCGGHGGVYMAIDKHRKIYGISLVQFRKGGGGKQTLPAEDFIRESGGIDRFLVKLWSRNSVGGLYRRAKTQYRCRKQGATQTTPEVVIDRLDSDTGLPMNPDYDYNDDSEEAVLGCVNI